MDATKAESPFDAVPWSVKDILQGVLLVISATFASAVLVVYLGSNGVLNRALMALLVTALLEASLLLVVWLLALARYNLRWQDLGYRPFAGSRDLLFSLVALLVGLAASRVYFFGAILTGQKVLLPPSLPAILPSGGVELALFAVVAVLITPVAEEAFFRGFVFAGIGRRFGVAKGAIISALLFSIAHVHIGLLVPTFLLGLILAWLYLKTRSLWNCAITHFAFNALALAAV